jgi:hypothetical protein
MEIANKFGCALEASAPPSALPGMNCHFSIEPGFFTLKCR